MDETKQLEPEQLSALQASQFLFAKYLVPSEEVRTLPKEISTLLGDSLDGWYGKFSEDIFSNALGYSKNPARTTPDLEDWLIEKCRPLVQSSHWKQRDTKPTLCLSHDIDYLELSPQLALKRLVGYRKLTLRRRSFIPSIKRLLEIETKATGKRKASTVFIALSAKSSRIRSRMTQWLIDPSYDESNPLFQELIQLLKEYECEVGVHGSFFSLDESLLDSEIERIEEMVGQKIRAGRQHWLKVPLESGFDQISNSGLAVDSTMGWNGQAGFRGGISRPYSLVLPKGGTIFEVPMVLMDGALFDDMKLTHKEALTLSKQILTEVKQRNGCVAINWHDRAADPAYNWNSVYEDLIGWANDAGFDFKTMTQAMRNGEGTA